MAVDEALTQEVREGRSRPALRFYTWVHPAISCGYFQDIERELDLEACRERGIEVVRRPTGGRAVFHGSDLTISLAALESEPRIGNDIGETYRKIAEAISCGLKDLGFPVELVRSQASGKESLSSASCFASKARHELVLEERKIFGGAQKRWEGVVLSQGSLQIWRDGNVPPELMRTGVRSFRSQPKALSEATKVYPDRVKEGIAEGFRRIFEVVLSPDALTEKERTATLKIIEKYRSPLRKRETLPGGKAPGNIFQPTSLT